MLQIKIGRYLLTLLRSRLEVVIISSKQRYKLNKKGRPPKINNLQIFLLLSKEDSLLHVNMTYKLS